MEQVPAAAHAVSGALGSSIANLLLYPLDVAIVRMQVRSDIGEQTTPDVKNASSKRRELAPQSISGTLQEILDNEGWAALFDGAADDLVATALQSLLYFFVYDFMRNRKMRRLVKKHGRAPKTLGIQEELWFGAVAGMFCKLFTTPIKNVVVHKQVDQGAVYIPPLQPGSASPSVLNSLGTQQSEDDSVILVDTHITNSLSNQHAGPDCAQHHRKTVKQCVQEICANKGLSGFWSGYRATLFLSANPSLSYYFYQVLATRGQEASGRVFLRAAIAKSMATVLTYPVILAKTRTQARLTKSRFYNLMWESWRSQGFNGLYQGVYAQLLKGFFSQGITMMTKEKITQLVVSMYILTRLPPRSRK